MTSSSDLPLPDLLRRMGAELTAQADAVRGLHRLVEGDASRSAAATVEAQTIDTASQHLDELAGLLARLAETGGGTLVAQAALDPIVLSGLRARLRGETDTDDEAGEVDFF